jgi:hypothetical protein
VRRSPECLQPGISHPCLPVAAMLGCLGTERWDQVLGFMTHLSIPIPPPQRRTESMSIGVYDFTVCFKVSLYPECAPRKLLDPVSLRTCLIEPYIVHVAVRFCLRRVDNSDPAQKKKNNKDGMKERIKSAIHLYYPTLGAAQLALCVSLQNLS